MKVFFKWLFIFLGLVIMIKIISIVPVYVSIFLCIVCAAIISQVHHLIHSF